MNPDEYWKMVAAAAIQAAAQQQQQNESVLRLNADLQHRNQQLDLQKQDLALRGEETKARVAASGAETKAAEARTKATEYGLARQEKEDTLADIDESIERTQFGDTRKNIRKDQELEQGAAQVDLLRKQGANAATAGESAKLDLAAKPGQIKLEEDRARSGIAANQAQTKLAAEGLDLQKQEAARKARIDEFAIQGKRRELAQELADQAERDVSPDGLTTQERGKLHAEISARIAPVMVEATNRIQQLLNGGKIPEADAAALKEQLRSAAGLTSQALAIANNPDPVIGDAIRGRLLSIALDQNLDDGAKRSEMEAAVAQYKSHAAKRRSLSANVAEEPQGLISLTAKDKAAKDKETSPLGRANAAVDARGKKMLDTIKADPERFSALERRIQKLTGKKAVGEQDVVNYIERYFKLEGPYEPVRKQDLYRMVDDLEQAER